MSSSVLNHRWEKSALKWLILIGLLWAQFAYADHRLAHNVDDIGEPCQICASCEQFEKALGGAVCAGTMPAAASGLPLSLNGCDITDHPRVYSARASPQSPDVSP